jgi:hypothetical protein
MRIIFDLLLLVNFQTPLERLRSGIQLIRVPRHGKPKPVKFYICQVLSAVFVTIHLNCC